LKLLLKQFQLCFLRFECLTLSFPIFIYSKNGSFTFGIRLTELVLSETYLPSFILCFGFIQTWSIRVEEKLMKNKLFYEQSKTTSFFLNVEWKKNPWWIGRTGAAQKFQIYENIKCLAWQRCFFLNFKVLVFLFKGPTEFLVFQRQFNWEGIHLLNWRQLRDAQV